MNGEEQRILDAYAKRKAQKQASVRFHCYGSLSHMYEVQERHRETLRLLGRFGYGDLSTARLLDVGCGDGNMLRQFMQWGATPKHLAGIDLRREPVERALELDPGLDVRCGSAFALPWPDAFFDLVSLHTVFTSILDAAMRARLAGEVRRVVRPGGAVLWYDFIYNNPSNPDVQAVARKQVRALFDGFEIHLKRITLAPPLGRLVPEGLLSILYPVLASVPFLCTHDLGLFTKP